MKRLHVLMIVGTLLIPVTMLKIEKGEPFILANIYEVMEFVCYFIAFYLLILAKIFEHKGITENKVIKSD